MKKHLLSSLFSLMFAIVYTHTLAQTNSAPAVALVAPANNATYIAPASVSLVAVATDADGTIAKVEFFNGTTLLPGSTNVLAPYDFTWTGVAAGTYTITAKATDNNGAVTTSAPVTIKVSTVTNIPPVVTLTAPANNTTYTAPASVSLVAIATDTDGTIAKVEFFNGTTLLPGSTNVLAPYEFTWTGVAAGTYTITAKATDNNGAVTTSEAVTIKVSTVTNIPPVVTLTAPANNATYTAPASVSLVAVATDADGTIAKVEFFNGTTLLPGSTNVSAPYEFTWTGVATGTYTITAKATDNKGAVTTSAPVKIKVDTSSVTNIPPVVALVTPANNATYTAPASVSLVAVATDADGTIAKVEFFNGTTLLPGSTNVLAPYEFTWTGVAAGTYTITAKATDNKGAVTTSAPVKIKVDTSSVTNVPPVVALVTPANNTTYTAPASVSLVAVATDADGTIAKVEFFNGTTLLPGSTNVLAPYEFTWTGVAAGTYTITAKATDNNGAVTTSAPVKIKVDTSSVTNIPPVVTLTSPANNATYTAPASVSIVAVATDADGTIAKVEFFNGTTLLPGSTNVLAPYEFTWTGVAAGTYTITAKATDNKGAVTTSAPVKIKVDTSSVTNIPPVVTLTSPANNTTYTAPASVSLVAVATDADGTIAKVEFFNGTTLLPGSTNVLAPYDFTWTGVAAGTYTITAKATDNKGAVTTSAPVTIKVDSASTVNGVIMGANPFTDQTTVKIPYASNVALTISIKDVSGITVWESSGLQTNQTIYLGSGLPTGIYIVTAYYAGTTKVFRLIKN